MTLQDQLKTLREKAGYTQEKAAPKIGVTMATLSRWERGECRLPADAIPKIREVYGLTDSEVLQLLERQAS